MNAVESRRALIAWFATPLGRLVVEAERQAVGEMLGRLGNLHLLQLGSYGDGEELPVPAAVRQWTGEAVAGPGVSFCAWPDDLPLASDSMDAVVLVHGLEFSDAPHTVLREAVRVLAPEGRLLVIGFNPVSLWGLCRAAMGPWRRSAPWGGHYYGARRLRDWCSLLDLDLLPGRSLLFRAPFGTPQPRQSVSRGERFGRRYLPWFGGVRIVAARKRVARIIPAQGTLARPRFLAGELAGGLPARQCRDRDDGPAPSAARTVVRFPLHRRRRRDKDAE